MLVQKQLHQIENFRHVFFIGYFGPMGVSALFYVYVALEFLNTIKFEDHIAEDAKHLQEAIVIIVWFLVLCSVVCFMMVALRTVR